jgi:endothelin-converting enzyme/putative endopeptidase
MRIRSVFTATAAALLLLSCSSETEAPLVSGVHLDALDRNTRPQDDFYQFVNGGWLDSTEIPDIYSRYTVYDEVRETVELALREIVNAAADSHGEPGSESQQVGDIFSSWMDTETINADTIHPAFDELDGLQSIDSVESLTTVMAELYRKNVQVPYKVRVNPDSGDSSRYAVYFEQSGITMPNRDYYLQLDNENFAKARAELTPYIAKMLDQAGMDPAAAADVYALEIQIAVAQWDAVRNRDPQATYNPYKVDALQDDEDNKHWSTMLTTLGFDGEEQIIVKQPSYFEALGTMLVDVPLETWKSYLAFRLMDSRALHLDATTAEIRFDYRNRILSGQKEPLPRWKSGIRVVNSLLGEAVGKLYVAEHFPPQAKAKMEELVVNVIATLDTSLDDLEWMSKETRVKAKEKLSKFTPKIGYPDEWTDYTALEIVAGDHYGNVLRAAAWKYDKDLAKLGGPVNDKEWYMTPQMVNAYYSPTRNEIGFPAARLQPPFFQLNADDAINYGAVGGVIGHEISHGFDDSGSQYDGDGNMVNWWSDDDRAAFDARTSVLVEQFSNFEPIEGMFVNGELTLGENIGDLSGVAMAYRAYINSLGGEEAPVIDGFTGPQRFFIGYAMSRKGKYQDERTISQLASDPHSPLKYRVNGPYPNIDAFHEAFETVEGDGMWLPPEERVRIW